MTMRPMGRAWLVAAVALIAAAGPARADGRPTLVVKFTGSAGTGQGDVPDALTQAMVDAAKTAGAQVLSSSTREDVLGIAGCADATAECLQQAVSLLEVDRLIVGDVRPAEGGATVSLLLVTEHGAARQVTLTVTGTTSAELVASFSPKALAFLRRDAGAATGAEGTSADATGATAADGTSAAAAGAGAATTAASASGPATVATVTAGPSEAGASDFELGRVEPATWVVVGSGAALLATSALLLVAASSTQDEVNAAPARTQADLQALADLEDTGKAESRWGNITLLTGGVALAVGAVLVYRDGHRGERTVVAPSPAPGGGGVTITWGF